jgi:hypothetical protein
VGNIIIVQSVVVFIHNWNVQPFRITPEQRTAPFCSATTEMRPSEVILLKTKKKYMQ